MVYSACIHFKRQFCNCILLEGSKTFCFAEQIPCPNLHLHPCVGCYTANLDLSAFSSHLLLLAAIKVYLKNNTRSTLSQKHYCYLWASSVFLRSQLIYVHECIYFFFWWIVCGFFFCSENLCIETPFKQVQLIYESKNNSEPALNIIHYGLGSVLFFCTI